MNFIFSVAELLIFFFTLSNRFTNCFECTVHLVGIANRSSDLTSLLLT